MQIRKVSNVRIRSVHTSQPITKNSIETLGIPQDEIEKYSLIASKLGVQESRILDGEDIVELVTKTILISLCSAKVLLKYFSIDLGSVSLISIFKILSGFL